MNPTQFFSKQSHVINFFNIIIKTSFHCRTKFKKKKKKKLSYKLNLGEIDKDHNWSC